MKLTKNIIKGWLTSLIGVLTMGISLLLVLIGAIDFVWSGVAGLAIGTILLLSPDTIVQSFKDMLAKFTTKT